MVDLAKDALISFNSNTAPVCLFQYTTLGPKIPESPEINTRTEPEPKTEPDPESGNPYFQPSRSRSFRARTQRNAEQEASCG